MTWGAHRRWERSVEAFVDGELPRDHRLAMLGHVQDCPDCGPHAALLLAVRAALVRTAPGLPALGAAPARRLARYGQVEGCGDGWGGDPG